MSEQSMDSKDYYWIANCDGFSPGSARGKSANNNGKRISFFGQQNKLKKREKQQKYPNNSNNIEISDLNYS